MLFTTDQRPFLLLPLQKLSTVRPQPFSTDSSAYCSSSDYPCPGFDTFPCSDSPICTFIPLGFCYSPASLDMPVTYHGRSQGKFLLNHTGCALTHPYISIWSSFRTVHSQIRQFARQSKHTNHRYFIEPRLIGNTPHLWGAFVRHLAVSYGYSQPLSWSFKPRPLQSTHVHQGQAFPDVTPSFHLLNYQFID